MITQLDTQLLKVRVLYEDGDLTHIVVTGWDNGNGGCAIVPTDQLQPSPSRHVDDHEDALDAVLLFYSAGMWDLEKEERWYAITGTREASTKALCDHIRKIRGVPTSD